MKAVLSNRIYLPPENPEHILNMEKELTYKIQSYRDDKPPIIVKNIRKVAGDIYSIPIGRTDLIPKDYEIKDKRILVPVEFPTFRGELRDSQQSIYEKIEDNALINASVSWGKTFTALAIAGKLGQKTLVVTHTIALRTQWEEQVRKVYGIEAGVIGSGKFFLDSPIVVGNIQSLYKCKDRIEKSFGTVIVDECHHIPANTFNKLVDASYARYKIGLSATMERKDGRHVVLRDYFSSTRYVPPAENKMTPSVDIIHTDIRFMDGAKTPWAVRVNDLVSQEEYGKLVSLLAAIYKNKGHCVLLVSDRVGFLERIKSTLGDSAEIITGKTSLDERRKIIDKVMSGECSILLGTQSMFSEGVSVNRLSCLILAAVINNAPLLEQIVGRIVREFPGKIDPVIVDINLKGNTAKKQAQLRRGMYLKNGYAIKDIVA